MRTACSISAPVLVGLIICIYGPWSQVRVRGEDAVDTHWVSTSAGKVLGIPKTTKWGKVVQYFGIPYAVPPTGRRRFMPSEPLLGESSDIHQNANSPPACMQPKHLREFSHPSISQGGVEVSEDCLKINVYKPIGTSLQKNLPILLFVPGNGYSFADMRQFDGSALAASGNLVVVTLNYRVGAFGFLSSGSPDLPGNVGLTDAVSAMKFIIHNAKAFGGAASNVTLAGWFSGSMLVSSLITSPIFYSDEQMTQPLAKKVIMHGGAATSDYAVNDNPIALLKKFAKSAQCLRKDRQEVLDCLQSLPASKLLELSTKYIAEWRPVVDGATLLVNPIKSVEFGNFSSDISFLIGDNLGSGSICYDTLKYFSSPFLEDIMSNSLNQYQFASLAEENIKEFYKVERSKLVNLTTHEYYYLRPGGNSWRDAFFQFCGSLYVRNPTELYARYASRQNAVVFRYEYAYRSSSSIYPEYFQGPLGDELPLLFPSSETNLDGQDLLVSKTLMETWTRFARYEVNDPSSKSETWKPFNELNKHLVGITGDGYQVSTTSRLDASIDFWRHVFIPLSKVLESLHGVEDKCADDLKTELSPSEVHDSGISTFVTVTILIGTVVLIGTGLYLVIVRARNRGYKWSW